MAVAYRWRMTFAIIATIIAAVFMLVIPQLLGSAINDAVDFLNFIASFGAAGGFGCFDFNQDGTVNTSDFLAFLASFGPCP